MDRSMNVLVLQYPHLILTRCKTDARAELKNNDNYSLGRVKSGFLRRSASPQYIPRHQTTEKQRVKNILYSEGKIRIALSYIFTSWRLENCQGFKCCVKTDLVVLGYQKFIFHLP